ncbi:MAG: dTMP kinase [Patescibacteria group bacterium]|nr:dTMP kinase [Patescibacteria group bacterium]MDE2116485.1 dTMP kinase [Patescibacteria group bacterium]
MAKGIFIVIDGGEGAGKGTQIARLKEAYPEALFTREPGGSEYAEEIRNIMLKSPLAKGASAETQFGLVWAARADHIRRKVMPALESGRHVISDRFDSSTFAYQLHGQGGLHLRDLFFAVRKQFLGDCMPDLYLFLEVDPEESIRRTKQRATLFGESNHFDEREVTFHNRVREGYREFARLFPGNCRTVDANRSIEEVWKSIEDIIKPLL